MPAYSYEGPDAFGQAERELSLRGGRRPRLLFVTWATLGFSTYAYEVAAYAAGRQDVDSVHIRLALRGGSRIVATQRVRGRGLLHPAVRQRLAVSERHVRGLEAVLRAGNFCAAHLAPASLSRLIVRASPPVRFSLALDTTLTLRGGGEETNRYLRRLDSLAFSRARFLTPMSSVVAKSLEEDFGIPPSRLLTTPPAVAIEKDCPALPRVKPARLLFVGNDWERKGGAALLGWHQRHFRDRVELHVFGGAPKAAPSSAVAVWFHGKIPRQELIREWLPTATALVLPSRLEMTPWVLIEAAAARLPAIACAVGSVPEIITDRETGYLLRRENMEDDFVASMSQLLGSPETVERLGSAAHAKALLEYDRAVVYGRLFAEMLAAD